MSGGSRPPTGRVADYTGRRVASGSPPTDDFTYSIVDIPASSDRRGEKRARTRLRDGLVQERRALVDCRILDRSKFGARLRLVEDRRLPDAFVLTDPASRDRFAATLVWQVGRDAGVRLRPIS